MALINHAKKEINAKLVYFGPPGAGKETSLTAVYRKLKPGCRGALKSMALQDSRMLFFDFIPPGQDSPAGYRVRFHIYTLADTVASVSHWNLLLKGADGVVFVADSSSGKMADNLQSLQLLDDGLRGLGSGLDAIPCVFQYNKRDVESALPLADLERSLNPGGWPVFPSSADRGEGVVDVLARLVRNVMKKLPDTEPETLGEEIQLHQEESGRPMRPPQDRSVINGISGYEAASGETVFPADGVAPTSAPLSAEVEFADEPKIVAADKLRIPLSIRFGGQEKRLTVTISLEES